MGIKDFIKQYEKMILKYSTSEQAETELMNKLDELEDGLLELERNIEDQRDLLDEYEYPTDYELADEFNYACRMC